MNTYDSDETFDRAMRERHYRALQQVSPATRALLRANRHAVAHTYGTPMRGWPLGAALGGFAAVAFAITLALNFNQVLNFDGEGRPGAQVASAVPAARSNEALLVTALDQDPDFYAWLESSDAQLMAME